MEMVEIVDKDLNIIYITSKKEAHEKGLLHKCVIAELLNKKGEMMLIRPPSHKQDAGQFVSPVGGHVRAFEKSEDALKREVEEEIGITEFTFKYIGKAIFNRKVLGRHENHYFLLYEITSTQIPKLGDEAETFEWFSKYQLRKQLQSNKKDFGDAYFKIVKSFYPDLLARDAYYVYILECADGTYYIGSTNNIERRIKEHNSSKRAARYTKIRRPVILRYFDELPSLSAARKREHELKKLSRKEKEKLFSTIKHK